RRRGLRYTHPPILSLRDRTGDGNRTRASNLEGWRSTTKLLRRGPCGNRTRDLQYAILALYLLSQQPITQDTTRVPLVGMAGFEPATPSTRTRCAPKLRHIPLFCPWGRVELGPTRAACRNRTGALPLFRRALYLLSQSGLAIRP